jgi:hypothetical protein
MSSWVAAIVKMPGGAWTKLRAHHVESTSSAVKPWVLIDGRGRFGTIEAFGENVARDLGSDVIAISAQTNADAYGIWHFRGDERARVLVYSRDYGGWLTDEGATQDWERTFFFDERATTSDSDDGSRWPDNLYDEMSDEDLARYEAAKKDGDARSILGLIHPSSLTPFARLCRHFDLELQKPSAIWNPPKISFLSRLFGR